MAEAKLKKKLRPVIMIFLFLLPLISTSDATDPILSWCSTNNNYTTNSTFAANLKTLLTSIATNTSIDNFGTAIAGSGKDAVYSLVQCRGDIPADSCRACLADMASQITKSCPAQKTATVLFDDIVGNRSAPGCLVHYENSNFFGTADSVNQSFYTGSDLTIFFNNATFNRVLAKLLQELTATATADTVIKNYAVGVTPLDNIQNMYGMVQCTQDLSATTCSSCLKAEFENIPVMLKNKVGGRAYTPSCSFRYELYKFYRVTTTPSPTPSPSSSSAPAGNATINAPTPPVGSIAENARRRSTVIIIAVFASAGCLIFTLVIFFFCCKKRIYKSTEYEMQDLEDIEALCFKLNTIKTATDNFSDNNKLGEGGYGPVYKGILKDGQEIAVKRMSSHSGQGMIEFKNEVQLIAKLQHRNLVRLLGCCVEGGEKILVYEFLLNTSLDKFLFDPAKNIELDWDTRYKIIVGAARGILYLHEESRLKIIHRDLKASNVLLDMDMNPKIADFGMAKLVHLDETQGNTSRIAGTFGYMSPEYVMQGKFSVKSDVFSFGVVVLEIISGQKNTSSLFQSSGAVDMLVHTWRLWRSGRALELLDESLSESAPRSEVLRCIHIGLLCVQEIPEDRPHMSSVVVMLSSETVTLPSPSPPAFFSATRRLILEDNSTNLTFSETSDYSKSGSEHLSANNGAFSHSEPR